MLWKRVLAVAVFALPVVAWGLIGIGRDDPARRQ